MLDKIKSISTSAQKALMSKLPTYDHSSQEYKALEGLLIAYRQLDALILAAEIENATAGLVILSLQLNRTSNELNAAVLLSNFLDVLALPSKTTFSMKTAPDQMSGLDISKLFSFLILMLMVVLIAMLLPSLMMSPLPWLYLAISALPLLITYGFDKPFSMSRWYQEMAGIEKGLAYSILGCGILCLLAVAALPEMTLLALGMMLISTLMSGLSLLQHSKHLQYKHEVLLDATHNIKEKLVSHNPVLQYFFKSVEECPLQSDVLNDMMTELRAIQ